MIAQLARKCLNLVLVVFLLTGCRGPQSPTPAVEQPQSEPTLTVPAGDDIPAQVSEGLVVASYSASGERTGLYDLQGQEISESASVPNSLPMGNMFIVYGTQ